MPEGFSDLSLSEPAASVPGMVELINRPAPWERERAADKQSAPDVAIAVVVSARRWLRVSV
ncbi:hypothetical protein DXT95_14355 [Agrobacterium tumefaciens]|nr:hypothetical protein [Agrobacterium tumefaciens]